MVCSCNRHSSNDNNCFNLKIAIHEIESEVTDMLKKLIESKVGPLSNRQFKTLSIMLDEDIKFNRITFKKMTRLHELLSIAEISANLIKRIA